MSYILTALKKSEAERAKGAVPRLTAQQAPAPRARGAAWPWIVGAALLANAAVVVLAWGPGIPLLTGSGRTDAGAPPVTPPPPVPDAAAMTAAAPAVPANGAEPARPVTPAPPAQAQRPPATVEPPEAPARIVEAPAGPPQSAPASPAAQPQTVPAASTGQQTERQTAATRDVAADDLEEEPPAKPAPRASLTVPAVSQTPRAPAMPGTAAVPRPPRKPVEALAATPRRPAPNDPVPLDGGPSAPAATGPELALALPAPAPPAPEAAVAPDPYASVPMLWQLPSAIRGRLPKLGMSVHVYAPEAPGRFVIVDRKKYREGDVLAGGARLEAILPDGIVLDFEGRRYRIAN